MNIPQSKSLKSHNCTMEKLPTIPTIEKTDNSESLPESNSLQIERASTHALEKNFSSLTWNEELLTRWLRRFYAIDIDIKENPDATFTIPAPSLPENLPHLPKGYGMKGGAARIVLRAALGLEINAPRDIDLTYIGVEAPDDELSDHLAQTYMPDDWAFGHGIEALEEDYFATRDFTWNEILYADGQITCSKQCLLDTIRNIVRIADFEKRESYYGEPFYVKPKLLAKAVRFIAEARANGNKNTALSKETSQAVEMGIDDWHIALHLNRAFEQGDDKAQAYVDELNERNLLPNTVKTAVDALHYLSEASDFIFRAEAAEILDREIRLKEELEEEARQEEELFKYEEHDTTEAHQGIIPFWRSPGG